MTYLKLLVRVCDFDLLILLSGSRSASYIFYFLRCISADSGAAPSATNLRCGVLQFFLIVIPLLLFLSLDTTLEVFLILS